MLGIRITIERAPRRTWSDLPDYGRKLIVVALLISLTIHALSYLSAQNFLLWRTDQSSDIAHPKPMTIHLSDANPTKSNDDIRKKQIRGRERRA